MNLSPLTRLSLITVPLAVVLEIAFLDLGHDPTYFGHLAPAAAALIRCVVVWLASVSVICALVSRMTRRKI